MKQLWLEHPGRGVIPRPGNLGEDTPPVPNKTRIRTNAYNRTVEDLEEIAA